MKKILLANIGNRNLKYKGRFLNPDTFRQETERLLNHFEEEKPYLEPEILPTLLDHLGMDKITDMVLFFSDTPTGDRNNQDTLFEADILIKLFAERYPYITVEKKALRCSVVDNNGLMQRYRDHLKRLKSVNPGALFQLCDAGGTAQQKAALKIIAEYLFGEYHFETYTVRQDAHPPVEAINAIEYRKVIDSEQIAALVTIFNYAGARQLYNLNQHYASKQLYKGLYIAENLFAYNLKDVVGRCHEKSFGTVISDYPVFETIGKRSFYHPPPELAALQLPPAGFFDLAVLLDIAEAHRRNRSFGFYVLYHHIFIERLLSSIIEGVTKMDIDNWNHWQLLKQKIASGALFQGYKPPGGRSLSEQTTVTVSVKITLVKHLKIPVLKPVLAAFTKLNSFLNPGDASVKIDVLRNKFAHEGRTITEGHHDELIAYTKEWRAFFGLNEETIFDRLNEDLQKLHHA